MQSKFKDLTFLKIWVYPSCTYRVFEHSATQREYRIIADTCSITGRTFQSNIIDKFSLVAPAPVIDLVSEKHFNNLSTYMSLGKIYR